MQKLKNLKQSTDKELDSKFADLFDKYNCANLEISKGSGMNPSKAASLASSREEYDKLVQGNLTQKQKDELERKKSLLYTKMVSIKQEKAKRVGAVKPQLGD